MWINLDHTQPLIATNRQGKLSSESRSLIFYKHRYPDEKDNK